MLVQKSRFTSKLVCFVLLFVGLQRLTAHLYAKKEDPYVVNLDPAVAEVLFPANIGMCFIAVYH